MAFLKAWAFRKTISSLRLDDIRLMPDDIHAVHGRYLCAAHTNDEARNPFGLRASFTLAAFYSRGTCRPTTIDVLMFHFRVRNGTGWDHQAMTTRLLPYFVLRTLYFVLQFVWLSSALAGCCVVCWLPWLGGRLASAWLILCVLCSSLTPLHLIQAEIACHRGGV